MLYGPRAAAQRSPRDGEEARLGRRGGKGGRQVEPEETERIDGDAPVGGEPVKMRPGDPPRGAHAADELVAGDRVSGDDEGAAQVEVGGDESRAVVEEDGRPAEIQIAHEGHDAAVRRAHRRAP